jgi:hypothetical protein
MGALSLSGVGVEAFVGSAQRNYATTTKAKEAK